MEKYGWGEGLEKSEAGICPFLSMVGEDLYNCEPNCMFFEDGKCVIAEGLKSLSKIKNIISEMAKKIPW